MRWTAFVRIISLTVSSIACAAAAAAQGPPAASKAAAPTVIELYTSQGCSSCPPADKLLQSYTKRDDIIALSFNVDYWDYLGWKDTLAKRAYSNRQRAYAYARGDSEVYTPQVVINGRTHAVGSVAQQIELAILKSTKNARHIDTPLKVELQKGQLRIDIGDGSQPKLATPATIWLAAVKHKVTVPIRHGENRGRTIDYYNVVLRLTALGMWSGPGKVIEMMYDDVLQGSADASAILIQQGKGGPIIAARWVDG